MSYREAFNLGRDGQSHWLRPTRFLVVADQGQVTGMVGVTRDITEHKRAEQEVAEKHRLLQEALKSEHEAMEKLKTAQGALVQSEKLAGLGQMVAGVAHEINNPLSFVANQ